MIEDEQIRKNKVHINVALILLNGICQSFSGEVKIRVERIAENSENNRA